MIKTAVKWRIFATCYPIWWANEKKKLEQSCSVYFDKKQSIFLNDVFGGSFFIWVMIMIGIHVKDYFYLLKTFMKLQNMI